MARVIVLLLLGAIVNVAVAWICVLWSVPSPTRIISLHDLDRTELVWPSQIAPAGYVTQWFGVTVHYTTSTNDPDSLAAFYPWAEERHYGWPSRGVGCGINYDGATRTVGLWPSYDGGYMEPGRPYFPLHPIWPGFAINTVFYAAILWLLLVAPGAIRRAARRRRGLCPACAYPVGQSPVCTECGAALRPNSTS